MMKTKKLKLTYLLWVLLIPAITFAQQSISGTITDQDTGEPLLGVTVLVQGTNKGTVSDFDGNYLINGLDTGDYVLEVSYTGYSKLSQAVTIGSSDVTQDLQMSFSASELDEIVVTGTGAPVAKKQLGNSIGSITTASLEKLPINSFSDLLAGREPGIVAFPSGGLTGEGAQIRIRGNASLSQLNEPIVIVDGIRVDRGGGFGGGFVGSGGGGSTSRLDDINPESIERVEILKGASAATLFGTEASNGVIQIFTKKGQIGAPKFSFKATQGFINYPMGAVPDNTGFTSDPARASQLSQFYGYTIRPYELISINAMEELYETGVQNTVNANVSGGSEQITYFTSARYSYTDGPFGAQERQGYLEGQETLATDIDRLAQFNMNLNVNPNDKWSIRLTQGYTSRFSSTAENNNNIYGVGSLAQFSKPENANENNTSGNIFATIDETLQVAIESTVNNYSGSLGVNFYPTDWIKIDATFGLNYSSQSSYNFRPFAWNIDGVSGSRPLGQLNSDRRNFLAQTGEVKASFSNNISSRITSNFIVGAQYVSQETSILGAQGTEFPGPGFEVASAAGVQNILEFFTAIDTAGIFAQEQIGFNDQLFVTLGARLDANSAFGSEFNAAFYPKVSASYIPSDSANWNDIGPISSLQLRGSYGWSGLQPAAFSALTSYQAFASATGPGIAPDNLGNPELAPEIAKEWEIGFTAGLIDDKVNLEFTYFDRVTEDALYARQFPLSGGFRNTQLTNIGELAAYGMEINLSGTVIRTQDLTLNLYVNGAYYRDEVVSLGGAPPLKVGGSYPRYRNFLIEGYAPGANFGAQLADVGANQLPVDIANSDGLPDTRDQLISYFTGLTPDTVGSVPTSIGTGSVLLADEDKDGDYLDHYLGKSTPDWTGSFGGSLSYKNFTLSTTFEYKAGNFVINNLTDAFRQSHPSIGRNLPNSSRVIRDFTTGGVDSGFNPLNDPNVRVDALDEWLNDTLALSPFSGLNTFQNADFISWNELSLNYQFTGSILDSFGLETASLGISGRNIAIFTGFEGVDPRINFVGRGSGSALEQNFGQGIAAFGYPIPRQAIITLKVGF